MPQPIFSFKSVSLKKKENNILTIKKFEVHRGATYVIDGNMGSGKTALIDILARNTNAKGGDCKYEQKKLSSYSKREYNDQVALVPQIIKAPWGTVAKFLRKTINQYSHITDVNKKLEDICRKMEIEHLLDRKMRELSPGELRWVYLSANIAADTKVLLIDEIEQHLSKSNLSHLIKTLYRKSNYDGVTIIATTQNKDLFTQRLASVTITLENGRITSVRSTSRKRKYSGKKKYGK
jgi:ABC-type cobalamin/Fe3+-siderophores transport system ATPase subunit